MTRFILARIPLIFIILLTLGVGGVVAYQTLYVAPEKKCEASGKWWAAKWRACATPMDVRNLPRLELPDGPAPAKK